MGGSSDAIAEASLKPMWRTLASTNMKPKASAPHDTAESASSREVIPHILQRTLKADAQPIGGKGHCKPKEPSTGDFILAIKD